MITRSGDLAGRVLERVFPGDSELAGRMRALDWSRNALGPPESWPLNLRIAIGICLTSRFPMHVWWGPELTMLYNDAYISFLGPNKHPAMLGRSGREAWAEIWDTIGPMIEDVLSTGKASWSEDILMFFDRELPKEEVYVTFSFSPVLGEGGEVDGMFCACTESTEKLVGHRRLETLRKLGLQAGEARTVSQACVAAAQVLGENPNDLSFAAIYIVDEAKGRARLVGSAGLPEDGAPLPRSVSLTGAEADVPADEGRPSPWPLAEVLRSKRRAETPDLRALPSKLPGGPWAEPARKAVVLPIRAPAHESLAGLLVAGVSPRRPFDAAYRAFLDLVAGHVATTIADASASEEVRRRAEALAELDRAKTAFFSNVSHELRTPLSLILGPLEELLRSDHLAPEARTSLEVVQRNALRLLKLVNTLLDFSRIEADRAQPAYKETDLAQLTADLASVFRSAAERAGLRLVVDCAPLPEPAYVDPDLWEKIVLNLLSNAFKFTFAGEIEVRLRADDGHAVLSVRDTGTGIPAEHLTRVFERFHRVTGARARTQEGTGIGLALVSELAKLHGGHVTVESQLDHGTTFRVIVPLGRAHLPADHIGAARPLTSTVTGAPAYVEEALSWLTEGNGDIAPAAAKDEHPGASARPRRGSSSSTTTPTCASTCGACSPGGGRWRPPPTG